MLLRKGTIVHRFSKDFRIFYFFGAFQKSQGRNFIFASHDYIKFAILRALKATKLLEIKFRTDDFEFFVDAFVYACRIRNLKGLSYSRNKIKKMKTHN